MDGSQIWYLVALLFSLAFGLFLVFAAVPSIARDRHATEMSAVRARLRAITGEGLHDLEDEAAEELDQLALSLLRSGAPSVSFLIVGRVVMTYRRRSGGVTPTHRDAKRRAMLTSRACSHAVDIDNLERRVYGETLRASYLGSKFWPVLWPLWLYDKRVFAEQAEAGSTSAEERAEDRVNSAMAARAVLGSRTPVLV